MNKMTRNRCALLIFTSIMVVGCEFIINQLAFFPNTRYHIPTDRLPQGVEEVYIETKDQIKLQSYLIRSQNSNQMMMYFHGNAGNIGHRLPDLIRLHNLKLNILGVGYRGYGKSSGSPSENGIYMDGEAAFKYATETLGFKASQIFILGRSIGTTVAVHTAQHRRIAGLILVTPLTSGKEYARFQGFGPLSGIAGDSFNNISKIQHLLCSLLIIHGTHDQVIPIEMGMSLYQKAPGKKRWVQIEGAGHNNISHYRKNKYWEAIMKFVTKTLTPESPGTAIINE